MLLRNWHFFFSAGRTMGSFILLLLILQASTASMEILGYSFHLFAFLNPLNVGFSGRPRYVLSLITHERRARRTNMESAVETRRLQEGRVPAHVKGDHSFHCRQWSTLSRSHTMDQPALASQSIRDSHYNITVTEWMWPHWVAIVNTVWGSPHHPYMHVFQSQSFEAAPEEERQGSVWRALEVEAYPAKCFFSPIICLPS